MKIDHHYEADVATVYALLTDPAFIERKYVALGGTDVAVDRSETEDGGCEVVTKRTVSVELPGFAKRVLSPTNTTVQTEVWPPADNSGERVCNYSVVVQGTPSRIEGTHTLSPSAHGGTDHHLDVELKISIPLIGGKLEKFAGDTAKADLDEQFVFTDKELIG